MKKWLMIFGGIVAVLVLLVVLAISFIDVNRFIPQLQAAAKEKGFDLQINGGISLGLWPSLGLQIKDVSLTPLATPARPLLLLQALHLQVPLNPLLQGDLVVEEINIQDANLDLWQDKEGRGNWEGPVTSTQMDIATTDKKSPNSFAVTLSKITLKNSKVKYQAQHAEPIALDNIDVAIQAINFQNKPFASEISGRLIKTPGLNAPLGFKLKQEIQLSPSFDQVEISKGEGQLDIPGGITLGVEYAGKLTDLTKTPQIQASFATTSFNARPYLELLAMQTQNPQALKNIRIKTDILSRDGSLTFSNGVLNLDQTPIQWQLQLPAKGLMAVQLQAEQVNLDDYLPPKAAANASQTQAAATADGLDSLKDLNASLKLTVKHLQVSQRNISNLLLQIQAQAGVLELQKIQGEIYQGRFNAEGNLRVKTQQRHLELTASLAGLQLEPLITELKLGDDFRLSGVIDGNVSARGEGASLAQLQKNLQADIDFNGQQMRMAPLNITEQYCKMVNMATRLRNVDNTWDAYTQMTSFNGKLQLQNQLLKLVSLQAAVEKLQVNVTAEADLKAGTYQAHLPITLAKTNTLNGGQLELKGCSIGSEFWVERSLPLLRCKGQLANLDPKKDCGPDGKGIGDLVKDYALYKLKKGEGINVDHLKVKADEKKEELRDKLQNQLGEDGAKKIEDKLKRLFRGKKSDESEAPK